MSGRRLLVAASAVAVVLAAVLLVVAGSVDQPGAGRSAPTEAPAGHHLGSVYHPAASPASTGSVVLRRLRPSSRPLLLVLVSGIAASAALVVWSGDRRRAVVASSLLGGTHRPRGPPAVA